MFNNFLTGGTKKVANFELLKMNLISINSKLKTQNSKLPMALCAIGLSHE
jgi:hypothetical protein